MIDEFKEVQIEEDPFELMAEEDASPLGVKNYEGKLEGLP